MSARQWNTVEVTDRIVIPFDWIDPAHPAGSSLGRAEFQVCIKFKRGKISEFWVYPTQTHITDCWHYTGGDIDFSISSYEGLDREGAWLVYWCKEHKTHCLSVYAPRYANFLNIDYHGLEFTKTRWWT